jgi:hypothetical protein
MRAFAEWVSSRRYRSVLTAAGFGLLSPLVGLLAPLAIPSAGVVVLAGLRHGAAEALLVLVMATVLLIVAWSALGGGATLALGLSLGLWLPALGVTELLRRSGSLSLSLQTIVIGVSLLAIVMFAAGDPVGEMQSLLDTMRAELQRAFQKDLSAEVLTNLARAFTAAAFGGTLVTLATSVLLGRWWQTLLGGGGFAAEFRQLHMSRVLALAFTFVLIMYLLTHMVALESVLCILGVGFVFQGLAVLHAIAAAQGLNVGWLVALYVALVATALYAGIVIGLIGWLDAWFDVRSRLQRRDSQR